MKKFLLYLLSGALFLVSSCAQKEEQNASVPPQKEIKKDLESYKFIKVSQAVSPYVGYAIETSGVNMKVSVKAAPFNKILPTVNLGINAGQSKTISSANAQSETNEENILYTFTLNKSEIGDFSQKFKMGIEVVWHSKDLGIDLRKERYMHINPAAAHSGLSKDSNNWATVVQADYKQLVTDKMNEINIDLKQPLNGKMTVVIEDQDGRRIRNLISGVKKSAGPLSINWDGTDDQGNLVKPGKYTWRSIHHPGIVPEHQLTLANGNLGKPKAFGSNHGCFVAATSNSQYAFLAAPLTEGGWSMIAVDENGKWQKGFSQIHGTPIHRIQVAASDKYFYAIHDGRGWGHKVDKTKDDWKTTNYITITRYDIESTQSKDFPGRKKYLQFTSYEHGPGISNPKFQKDFSLAGAAYFKDRLFVATKHEEKISVFNPENGEIIKQLELKNPGPLAANQTALYGVSGDSVIAFSQDFMNSKTVIKNSGMNITGLDVDEKGKIYVSDTESHTIKVFDQQGKLIETIGRTGGNYQGKYFADRFVEPRGISLFKNKLWITEDRWNPKRSSCWDLSQKKVTVELIGNPHYGSSGGGFDTKDHSKWVALNTVWNVDFNAKKGTPTGIMGKKAGRLEGNYHEPFRYEFYHQDGRTFLLSAGKISMVCELLEDGSVKDLAAVSNMHMWAYACNWELPQALIDALPAKYDELLKVKFRGHKARFVGCMWVDLNGDGKMQKEEFNFSDDYAGFSDFWGSNQKGLTLRLPISQENGIPKILVLKPDGYHPGGAPKYTSLNEAISKAVSWERSIKLKTTDRVATTVDRKNNLIYNAEPSMLAVSPEGKILWEFPNQWVNVHGSHKAPLPETGVMQGNLFFLGCAPLDSDSDVFILNGNHGRFFMLTSDGMYLDEMFRDVRTGRDRNYMMIGGEPFGGFFAKSEKDGNYYLQTSGDGYRIYKVKGLDKVTRQSGILDITKDQIMAAERNYSRKAANEIEAREADIPKVSNKINIDGKSNEWDREFSADWDKNGLYRVRVKASHDSQYLYLNYNVQDETPWVNNGKDWTTLFKTGDSVDLQIGVDTKANTKRSGPAPGDMRILIGKFNGEDIAVLYKHRLKKGEKKDPVTFTSPWRSETVDKVEKIADAKIKVNVSGGGYEVEAAIPLSALGVSNLSGLKLKGDFGVIYGDDKGTINFLRNYWSNKATGLVNDVPGEIMLNPANWGTLKFK